MPMGRLTAGGGEQLLNEDDEEDCADISTNKKTSSHRLVLTKSST